MTFLSCLCHKTWTWLKHRSFLSCICCLHSEYRIESEWYSISVWQLSSHVCMMWTKIIYLLCIIFIQSHRFICPLYFRKVCGSRTDTKPKAWYGDVLKLFTDFKIYSPRTLIHKCTRTPSFYIELFFFNIEKCKNTSLERLLMQPWTKIQWLWKFQHYDNGKNICWPTLVG